MTELVAPTVAPESELREHVALVKPDHVWRRLLHNGRFVVGGVLLALILGSCIVSLHWTGREDLGTDEDGYPIKNPYYFDAQDDKLAERPPTRGEGIIRWFGTDKLGRSILTRCLYGGTVSLEIGAAAAIIAVVLGVSVGLIAGYRGGWIDALLMRFVDVMYGLPYVLLIILFKIALEEPLSRLFTNASIANRAVLFMAIGLVSWLTMARVVSRPSPEPARPAVHRSRSCHRAASLADLSVSPAAQHRRPDHRLRDVDCAAGHSERIVPQLSGDRHPGADADLGLARRRRPHAGPAARPSKLVDAPVSVYLSCGLRCYV